MRSWDCSTTFADLCAGIWPDAISNRERWHPWSGLPFEQFNRQIQIVRAFTLWQPWQGYDAKKYAELLREAFEPFEHFAGGSPTSEAVETLFSGQGRRKA